jgi:acetoin utilization deacetylase AcuC-like enzyme
VGAARVLLVDDPRFGRHVPPGHHPERPERLVAARAALAQLERPGHDGPQAPDGPKAVPLVSFDRVAVREATNEELGRVHSPRFVEALAKLEGAQANLDPDTFVSPDSVATARLAAGSLVAMVDAMLDGPISKGVALLRPPGHHARPAQAMGFCLLNSIAVAAAHARARGVERVAIVDWDVHHGNGTQEMFWRDPGVLYVSTHQFPFYPGTGDVSEVGEGAGTGFTVNIPLPAGGGDSVYRAAFQRVVLPVLESYAPELVLVSAGYDAAARDPLAQMELSAGAFGWMAEQLARVSARSTHRMALVLEGGYDLVSLEAGLRASIEGMLGGEKDERGDPVPASEDERRRSEEGYEAVERAGREAKKTWGAVG